LAGLAGKGKTGGTKGLTAVHIRVKREMEREEKLVTVAIRRRWAKRESNEAMSQKRRRRRPQILLPQLHVRSGKAKARE
jgi:hypothetical protein